MKIRHWIRGYPSVSRLALSAVFLLSVISYSGAQEPSPKKQPASYQQVLEQIDRELLNAPLVNQVDVPCDSGDSSRNTKTGQGSSKGLRPCAVVKQDLMQRLETAIEQDRVRRYYPLSEKPPSEQQSIIGGCQYNQAARLCRPVSDSPDLFKKCVASARTQLEQKGLLVHPDPSSGVDIDNECSPYGPVCNPTDGEVRERNGKSCGQVVKIQAEGGIALDEYGTLENNHRRGGWVQALRCYKNEVLNEIQSGTVRATTLECRRLGTYVAFLFKRTPEKKEQRIPAQANIDIMDYGGDPCINELKTKSAKGSYDAVAARNRQSSCNLSAGRAVLEDAMYNFVTCENLSRAKRADAKAFVPKDGPFQTQIMSEIVSPCTSKAVDSCVPSCIRPWGVSKGCVINCSVPKVQSCYNSNYDEFMKRFLQKNFPTQGKCFSQNETAQPIAAHTFSLLPFLIGMLGLRRKRALRLSSALAAISLGIWGCDGGSSNTPKYESYCTGLDGALIMSKAVAKTCCGSKGAAPLVIKECAGGNKVVCNDESATGGKAICGNDQGKTQAEKDQYQKCLAQVDTGKCAKEYDPCLMETQTTSTRNADPHQAVLLSNGKAPDSCPQSNGNPTTTLTQGVDSVARARTNLAQAYVLDTQNAAAVQDGGNSSAATALDSSLPGFDGLGLGLGNSKSGSSGGANGGTVGTTAAGGFVPGSASGKGGGGGGGGSQGSSVMSDQAAHTDAASPNGKKSDGVTMDMESGGLSSSSGGGAPAAGSAGAGSNPFSSLGGAFGSNSDEPNAAGLSDDVRFGRRLASDVPPIVSVDPTDYFNRIESGTSLFKVVERKYREKSISWSADKNRELSRGMH